MLFQYYGGYVFQDAIYWLDQLGVRDVILPFFLIFTLLFAVLEKTQIFTTVKTKADGTLDLATRKPNKRINGILALCISLLAVIPHVTGSYPPGADIILMINNFLPQVALLAIVIVMFVMMLNLGGGDLTADQQKNWRHGIVGIAAVMLIIIFGRVAFYEGTPSWLSFLDSPGFWPILIIILGIIVAFGLVVGMSD